MTELLSEDLNALRQGRAKAQPQERAPEPGKTEVRAERIAPQEAPKSETSDPFAFDLGPSPFASKPEAPRPAPPPSTETAVSPPLAKETEPAAKPAPQAAPQSAPASELKSEPQFGPSSPPTPTTKEPAAVPAPETPRAAARPSSAEAPGR